ncbi:hypothetical protein BLS_002917 [Venturia inaequalis]|uniref:Uncharacterized protein n=1 Tax=Venturia inaequalis TaxID=5025 RepID=A0A8H3USM2_VENIN|nr:hypothetical protein BLS_002917 [Venturia inaequalis]
MEFPVLHSGHHTDGESEAGPELVKRRLRSSTPYPVAPKPSPSPAAILKTTLTKPKTNPYATRASSKQPVDIYEVPDDEESDDNESDDDRSHAGSDKEDEGDGIAEIPSPEPETPTLIKRGRGRPTRTLAPTTSKTKAPQTKTSTSKTQIIKKTKPPPKAGRRSSPRLHPKKGDELWALSSPWNLSQKHSTPVIVRTGPIPTETYGEIPAVANRKPIVRDPSSLVVPQIQKKSKTKRKKVVEVVEQTEDQGFEEALEDEPEVDTMDIDQELGDAMDVDHEQDREVDQAHYIMDHPPLQAELDHILSILDDYQDGLSEKLAQTYNPPTAPGRSLSGQSNTRGPLLHKNSKQPYTSLSALVGLHYHEFPDAVQKSIDDIIDSTDSEGMRILIGRLVGHPSTNTANDNGTISAHSTAERYDQKNEKPKTGLKPQHHNTQATSTSRPYTDAATRPQRQFSLLRLNPTSSFGPSLFEDNLYQDYLDNGGLHGQNDGDREAAQNELEKAKATAVLTTKSKDVMHNQLRGAFTAIAQALQTNKGLNEALRPFPTDGAKLDKAMELLHGQTNTWAQILGVPKQSSAKKGAAVRSQVKMGAVLNGSTKKGKTVKGPVQTEMAMRGPAMRGQAMKEAATKRSIKRETDA